MEILGSARQLAGGAARKLLDMVNIDPALVKALVRKPQIVHGGPPARRLPWPRRRHFGRQEFKAVTRLMKRERRRGGAIVYNGVETREYCRAFSDYLGGGLATAVNSGTNAVYVALRALDLEPGSEVIVPPITDPGGTMPVVMLNCVPIPADSDAGSLNTSAEQIGRVVTDRTAAIVVAHISGHPVDMDPILELAAARGIPVVEDCAQAHGALYKGQMVGTRGAIAAFSTMFGKHHYTGAQGGVVFTRDTLLFARARQIADRGKPHGALHSQGNLVASLNFNQDEISMAIGRVQLERLPGALQTRRSFASLVEGGLAAVDGVSMVGDLPGCTGSYWFLILQFDRSRLTCSALELASALLAEGISGVHAGYAFFPTEQPWHRDAVIFGKSGLPWSMDGQAEPRHFELPNAHEAERTIVRVDVHEQLGSAEAKDLVAAIQKVSRYYKRSSPESVGDSYHTLSRPRPL